MINGIMPLAAVIQEQLDEYENAKFNLEAAIEITQAKCTHPQVIHAEYRRQEYFGSLMPLRMCVCCRLEEEGSVWSNAKSWSSRGNYGTEGVLNNHPNRLVITVDRQEIYDMRLPGKRYLANEDKDE